MFLKLISAAATPDDKVCNCALRYRVENEILTTRRGRTKQVEAERERFMQRIVDGKDMLPRDVTLGQDQGPKAGR